MVRSSGAGHVRAAIGAMAAAGARRSLLLFALGAIVGLGIAGYGLFSSAGSALALVPPEDVATVNQRPILKSDYIAQLESQFGVTFAEASDAQKRKVLTDMVNEELMVQRGTELDLAGTDSDVRAALVSGVALQVGANVMAARPSNATLRAYYERNRERYRTNGTLSLDELVLPRDADVAAAAARLRRSDPASAVAGAAGGRVARRIGPETFDLTARLKLGDAAYAAVETLRPGEVSAPVVLAEGVHLLRVTQRLFPLLPPFEQSIKTVYADYLRSAREPVEAANYRYLRNRARILYAPGYRE